MMIIYLKNETRRKLICNKADHLKPYLYINISRVFINLSRDLECLLIHVYLGVSKFGCSVCALHQPKVGRRKFKSSTHFMTLSKTTIK